MTAKKNIPRVLCLESLHHHLPSRPVEHAEENNNIFQNLLIYAMWKERNNQSHPHFAVTTK